MNRVKGLCIALVLSVAANILVCAALIAERSSDVVRVTVWDDEVLPTVRALQPVVGKVAYAYPVNNTETKWRVVIDDKSEVITK